MFKNDISQRKYRNAKQKLRVDSEIAGLREQLTLTKFCLDRFKQNEPHFKFYTGLETYD